MKKIVVFVAAVVLISSSIHSMQQSYKPAMQDMQHKFAMNKKHSSKMGRSFSTNQVQLAALAKKAQVKDEQTAKFYRMPCKTGTALIAFTTVMCFAALSRSEAYPCGNSGIHGNPPCPGPEKPPYYGSSAYQLPNSYAQGPFVLQFARHY